MSMPSIPGFIERPGTVTLANLWPRPAGDFPDELWPLGDLATVTSKLTGWLTVDEHFFTDGKHGGVGCVLVDPGRSEDALTDTTWIGRDLGNVSIWDDDRFESGLKATEKDIIVEFFVQARRPSGVSLPVVEFSHPFLWYWDAFPTGDGWKYLNRAGRAQELVRWMFADDGWRVEVRALEFRQFLAACARTAIIQVDYVTKTETAPFDRVDDEFDNDWSHFDFHVLHDSAMGDRPSFSRLLGQYAITGQRNSRVPRFEERRQDREYPAFIYAVDEDGNSLAHTCDPDKLGTYFDRDGTRHHYLTPIYFKREVLQPYVAEPSKYSVSPSRLSCLDLWGVDISFNSADLVEVYLGDLGRDLPSDEWGHWLSYNVPPEGQMDEGRFRRDFLNQIVSSKDIVGDLRRARAEAVDISQRLLGDSIWKPLAGDIKAEFDSLIGPLTDEPASLGPSLLVLTKVLVDGIDPKPLKRHLKTHEKGERSLRLLHRYSEELGNTSDITAVLRDLQAFRSKGGVAHLAGSGKDQATAALGISGLSNAEAFRSVVQRAASCLRALSELMAQAGDVSDP